MKTQKQTKSSKVLKPTKITAKRPVKSGEVNEPDSTYLLKLVFCVLLGSFWLGLSSPIVWAGLPFGAIPLGLFIGLVLVRWLESYQTDRKIWYAILVIVTILGYFLPTTFTV